MDITINFAFSHFREKLSRIYEFDEANTISNWVFEHVFNRSRIALNMDRSALVSKEQYRLLKEFENQLLTHKPVQYVLGECHFYGLKFKVDERVLIPRPETEELVDWIIKEHIDHQYLKVVDIGTGSGCIPLSLKKNKPNWHITGVDNDSGALENAKENAHFNQLDVNFLQMDILQETTWESLSSFDIIISNPPYILPGEEKNMKPNVLQYEPHQALFVSNNDPLQFYKKIEQFAQKHLNNNGNVYMELHSLFAKEINEYFQLKEWHTELKYDLFNRPRMLKASKK